MNANLGLRKPFLDLQGLRYDINLITKEPRKYGFHGTLKPPFALKAGNTQEELLIAVGELAGSIKKFKIQKIQLETRNGFVALIPEEYSKFLQDLEFRAVRRVYVS